MLGGTFDPVHLGHIAVASQCRARLQLSEVRLVPSFRPPHRPPPLASAEDRLAMTRLAAADDRGLVVDDLEVRRGGTSYSVDTLRELRQAGRRRLVLLLGYDAALEFKSWHLGADIPGLAEIVVFNRTAGAPTTPNGALPPGAVVVAVDSPDISATDVRERLAAGAETAGMLAPSVLAYIRDRGLYGAGK